MKILARKLICLLLILGFQPAFAVEPPRLICERCGDKIQLLLPGIGFAAAVFYEDAKATHYEGIREWSKAFITFEIAVESLKMITHKERPNRRGYESFPSGHTAAGFMGAGFIHRRYGFVYAIPAYVGAAFVGYTRIQANKHFGEDVMAGAVIGLGSSLIFTTPYKGVNITPMCHGKAVGLSVGTQW